MYEDILIKRLNGLYTDLTCKSEEAENLVNFMCTSLDDKRTFLKDMYYRDHAPVKVLNPSYTGVKGGKKDIEAEIISISEGYDSFIKKLGNQTSDILSRHSMALELFVELLSMPEPYSRLLYLRYFKGLDMDEVSRITFMSKSSCYRKIEKGVELLIKRYMLKDEE